jgi:hypothetical protein
MLTREEWGIPRASSYIGMDVNDLGAMPFRLLLAISLSTLYAAFGVKFSSYRTFGLSGALRCPLDPQHLPLACYLFTQLLDCSLLERPRPYSTGYLLTSNNNPCTARRLSRCLGSCFLLLRLVLCLALSSK